MRRRRILLTALLAGLIGFFSLPVAEIERPTSTVLLDREGRLLGARIATDEQWRFPATDQGNCGNACSSGTGWYDGNKGDVPTVMVRTRG